MILLVLDIILLTALNIYFVGFQGKGIEGIVQANLISSVSVFIITLPIILKRFRLDLLSLSHWKTLKEFALPLMPAGLFWMILAPDVDMFTTFSIRKNMFELFCG